MVAIGSYTGKLTEISSELAEANAYMALALRPDDITGLLSGQTSGVSGCIARLAAAIPGITSWGFSDSNTSRLITNSMTSFVNELHGVFVDLFVPVDFDQNKDPEGTGSVVDAYMKSVLSSLSNPLAAVIATQQGLLTSGLQQIKTILYADEPGKNRGIINQYSDRLERIFKAMFVGDADLNIGGMMLFAFEEGIPAIEMEQVYLRKLKKLAKKGLEDVANLPDIIQPTMMNSALVSKLCCAEKELLKVEDVLRRDNVFDRKTFGAATKCVCEAKDQIFNGSIDKDFLQFHAGNLTGLTQAQVQSITSLRFMPSIQFRLNLIQINLYANAFEEADRITRTLHNNFLLIVDTIDQLAETRLGDIIALIVGLLRRQISGVRADLEAQAQGFSGYNDAQTEATERKKFAADNQQATINGSKSALAAGQVDAAATAAGKTSAPYTSGLSGTPAATTVHPGEKGAAFGDQQVDIYAYMSAQASAYVVLASACGIMQQTSKIYSILDSVLSGESRLIAYIKKFVKGLQTECPNAQGGGQVVAATAAYVRALEDRLNGKTTSNQKVIQAAHTMIRRIDEYEKFLKCFKQQMFFGNEGLMNLITALANAVAAYKQGRALVMQIRMMIRMYPQLREMYRTMDLNKMLGMGGVEYNALDTVVGALQCLVLQCDNPYISDLVSSASSQFRNEFDKRRSTAITMGALDDIPKTGMLSIILAKAQAVLRLIQFLNSLTNINVKDLCNIKTPANAKPVGPVGAILASGLTGMFANAGDEPKVIDTSPWRQRLIESGVKRRPDGSIH